MIPTLAALARVGCPEHGGEPMLRKLVGSLFTEGWLSAGSVLDAGADDGSESCDYAQRAPKRLVHAVEPLGANVQHIQRSVASGAYPRNVLPLRGGLSSAPGWTYLESNSAANAVRGQLVNGVSLLTSTGFIPKALLRACLSALRAEQPGALERYLAPAY